MSSTSNEQIPTPAISLRWQAGAAALIAYLVFGSGIFSDDFALIAALSGLTPAEMLWPGASSIATPLTHLTHAWFYYLIGNQHIWLYDCVKAIYLLVSMLLFQRFFSLWFAPHKSLIVAGLFVLYPIHDATTYWFIGQYLLLSFAFYAYAFYLLSTGRTVAAFGAGLFGSFISYGSTAVACGLALIFALRRDYRRAALLLAPNLIYITYYLVLTVFFGKGVSRIPGGLDLVAVAKQFVLQIATFLDAAAGPSFWLKLLLSIGEITIVSAIVAGLALLAISRSAHEVDRAAMPKELV